MLPAASFHTTLFGLCRPWSESSCAPPPSSLMAFQPELARPADCGCSPRCRSTQPCWVLPALVRVGVCTTAVLVNGVPSWVLPSGRLWMLAVSSFHTNLVGFFADPGQGRRVHRRRPRRWRSILNSPVRLTVDVGRGVFPCNPVGSLPTLVRVGVCPAAVLVDGVPT